MARRAIRLYGDPILRAKATPVEASDPSTEALVADLFDSLHHARGIGLAAPQIGVPAQVFVIDLQAVELGAKPLALINPEVVSTGPPVTGEEGCLSFPGLYVDVDRPEVAQLRFTTLAGQTQEIQATGLMARAMLHELDHLDGVLFVDGLSSARRVLVATRLKQMQRRQRKGETA